MRGTVKDQTGAVIPNVNVALINTATNVESKTVTNSVGLYVFPAVLPGPYKLMAESAGMAKFEGTLTVRVQESSTVDVVLTTAVTTQSVVVQDVTPMVTSDSQTLGHVLERARIEQLPLNGRQVMNLLNTVPGMTFDSNGDLRTFGERTGTHDISLDGAALGDPVYAGGMVNRQPSLESIQEFKVDMNSVSAKNPRQTNVVMTTKSGSNEIHGSLFETNRDNYYGFARRREDGNIPGKYIRNEFGGTVGGPVYIPKVYNGKNKTFFFFADENYRQRAGTTGRWKVPTEAMRNGDFTGLVSSAGTLSKIYDPYSTDPVTHERQQFAYNGVPNTIDPSLESPLFKYFASVLPMPNQPGVNPLVANNYYGPKPDTNDQWTWSLRVDQRFGDKDQFYARFTDSYFKRFRAAAGGVPTTDGLGNSRTDVWPNKSLATNWTHSFSPTFFSEFSFNATRSTGGKYTGANGTYATMLGLPNPNNQVGYPVIGAFGLSSGNYFQPVNATDQWFNFFIMDENLTKTVGRHEIQFGGHFRYDQLTYLPQQQRSAGSVTFRSIGTALYDPNYPNRTQSVLNTGSALASAYLGVADYEYRVNKGKYYMRQNEDAMYIQDSFKVNSRLTLLGGLRWQFSPYPKDKYDIFSAFDTKNMAIVLGRDLDTFYKVGATSPAWINYLQNNGAVFESTSAGGFPKRLIQNNWHDIGPHVGFAYKALDGRKAFVVRGGYSTSYFPIPMWGWNDAFRNSSPFAGFYANPWMSSSSASPDGVRNYGLVSTPKYVAGKNSSDAINLSQLNPASIIIGEDAYSVNWFAKNQPSARVHDWNLTLEKELANETVLRVTYIGTHLSNQDSYNDLNQQIPGYVWYKTTGLPVPDGNTASADIRPFNQTPYGDLHEYRRDGWGNTQGGIVEVERRFSKGYGFQLFYQLVNANKAASHGWYGDSGVDPVSSYLPGVVPTDQKSRMRLLLYGRDTTVPKHEIRFNWIMELPVGRGKSLLRNAPKALDYVVGGWQVSGMGHVRSNYFTLPNDITDSSVIWPTGTPVEYYGHKYPIQDCRSGECQPGYLLWNGYIPEYQINQPGGIMGVPANYKPAGQPVNPYPANYLSLQGDDPSAPGYDPNYGYYGTNNVFVTLKDGTQQPIDKGDLHPWRNQPVMSTRSWGADASIFKNFRFKERVGLRFQADFFNVFNTPGNEFNPGYDGVALTNYSMQDARQLQLTARFSW